MMNTGRGFFRNTVAVFQHVGVFVVNERCQISTVIEDQVKVLAVLEGE